MNVILAEIIHVSSSDTGGRSLVQVLLEALLIGICVAAV